MIFPTFSDSSERLLYFSHVKKNILSIAEAYKDGEPDEQTKKRLLSEKNWFITKDGARNFKYDDPENILFSMERNYYNLLSIMNFTGNETVMTFHGKIDQKAKENSEN